MSTASNSRARVSYIPETVMGTTPATPALQSLRVTGETLNVIRTMATSKELNGNRGDVGAIQLYGAGAGGVQGEYSHGVLDDIIVSALRAPWAANICVQGDTPSSLTLEHWAETGATDVYTRLTGAEVDKLTLSLKPNEVAKFSAEFQARQGAFFTATIAGSTYVAGSAEPVIAGPSIGSIAFGGGLTVDALIDCDITFANNLAPQKALGNLGPLGFGSGRFECTGKFSLFLNSTESDIVNAFAAGTHTSLTLVIGTTTLKKLQIEILDIVLENLKTDSTSKDGDLIITTDFRAVQASALSGAVARITRQLV